MALLSPKKIFKEKKSIKSELEKAFINKTPTSYSILAKSVGISLHRVKKYCKNHSIDLNNYNLDILNQPVIKIKDSETKKRKIKKIIIEQPINHKIVIGQPKDIKFELP